MLLNYGESEYEMLWMKICDIGRTKWHCGHNLNMLYCMVIGDKWNHSLLCLNTKHLNPIERRQRASPIILPTYVAACIRI